MKELTHEKLLLLVLGTVALSIGMSFFTYTSITGNGLGGITGMVLAPNGTATLTIATQSSIVFVASSIDWGTGSVNSTAGFTACALNTVPEWDNTGCTQDGSGFFELDAAFGVENDGNTNLTVELQANKTATDFIGTDQALFLWNVSVNESGTCINESGALSSESSVNPNTTTDCHNGAGGVASCGAIFENVTTSYKVICPRMRFESANDLMRIDLNVSIPQTAPAGVKNAQLTVRGTRDPLT